jgi:flavin-binding protein dodecin
MERLKLIIHRYGWEDSIMAVVKVIELIGESTKSWEDAAQSAISIASKTLRNIFGVDIVNQTAKVEGGKIVQYRTTVKIAFLIEAVKE